MRSAARKKRVGNRFVLCIARRHNSQCEKCTFRTSGFSDTSELDHARWHCIIGQVPSRPAIPRDSIVSHDSVVIRPDRFASPWPPDLNPGWLTVPPEGHGGLQRFNRGERCPFIALSYAPIDRDREFGKSNGLTQSLEVKCCAVVVNKHVTHSLEAVEAARQMCLQRISHQQEIRSDNFSHRQSVPRVDRGKPVEIVKFLPVAQQRFSSRVNHSVVKRKGTGDDKNCPRLRPRDSQTSENLLERSFHTLVHRKLSHPTLQEVR